MGAAREEPELKTNMLKVIGRVIEALDVKWHPECFGCYMCGAELCENGFFKHNGRYV